MLVHFRKFAGDAFKNRRVEELGPERFRFRKDWEEVVNVIDVDKCCATNIVKARDFVKRLLNFVNEKQESVDGVAQLF